MGVPVEVHPPLYPLNGAQTTETMTFEQITRGPSPNSRHNCANEDFNWQGIEKATHTGHQYWPKNNPENPIWHPDLKKVKGVSKEHFHLELGPRVLALKNWMYSLVEQYQEELQAGGKEHAVVIVTHSSLIKQLTRVLRLSERHMTPGFVNAVEFIWTYGEENPDLFLVPRWGFTIQNT